MAGEEYFIMKMKDLPQFLEDNPLPHKAAYHGLIPFFGLNAYRIDEAKIVEVDGKLRASASVKRPTARQGFVFVNMDAYAPCAVWDKKLEDQSLTVTQRLDEYAKMVREVARSTKWSKHEFI